MKVKNESIRSTCGHKSNEAKMVPPNKNKRKRSTTSHSSGARSMMKAPAVDRCDPPSRRSSFVFVFFLFFFVAAEIRFDGYSSLLLP